jgi:hypothetical protein
MQISNALNDSANRKKPACFMLKTPLPAKTVCMTNYQFKPAGNLCWNYLTQFHSFQFKIALQMKGHQWHNRSRTQIKSAKYARLFLRKAALHRIN